jgi:hypothetical protein
MFVPNGITSYFLITVLVIIPFWKIFKKAGFPPAISLFTVIPIVNLLTLYWVAFSRWPGEDNRRYS